MCQHPVLGADPAEPCSECIRIPGMAVGSDQADTVSSLVVFALAQAYLSPGRAIQTLRLASHYIERLAVAPDAVVQLSELLSTVQAVTARLHSANTSVVPTTKSVVRQNAEQDPNYRPYCLRCSGNQRMQKKAPFYWEHKCGAVHDERLPADPLRRGTVQFNVGDRVYRHPKSLLPHEEAKANIVWRIRTIPYTDRTRVYEIEAFGEIAIICPGWTLLPANNVRTTL